MPITNNNGSSSSSPRGRGRPALGNVDRLFARFCDAYRDGVGLRLSMIASEFGWTEGTARAMVSQVRTTHNVTIYYRRRSAKFYLQSLPANAPTLRAPGQSASPAPAPAVTPTPAQPSLAELIRERLDAPAAPAAPVAAPVETVETLAAAFAAIDPGRDDAAYWRNLITRSWIAGTTPVMQICTASAFASLRDRARTFVTTARARARADRYTPVAPVAAPTVPDSLWRGIDPAVASFYRERALDLRQ